MPVQIEELVTQILEQPAGGQALVLTPEQIRLVADKVYAMLLNELRIESERSRNLRRPGKGAN